MFVVLIVASPLVLQVVQPKCEGTNNQEAVFYSKKVQGKCNCCGGSHFLRDCHKKDNTNYKRGEFKGN